MRYKFTTLQLSGNKLIKDAQALLELLNEKEHKVVKMNFTKACGGRANVKLDKFTIPKHAIERGEAYLLYYVIHEFTHCLGYYNHDKSFKTKERNLLNEFGLDIDYAKAYPKRLYLNGEKVYEKPKQYYRIYHRRVSRK